MKFQTRHHATRKYEPGVVFSIYDALDGLNHLWILLQCEPEPDGTGNKLTLRKMTKNEETVHGVMET